MMRLNRVRNRVVSGAVALLCGWCGWCASAAARDASGPPAARFEGVCTFSNVSADVPASGFVLQEGDKAVWVLPPRGAAGDGDVAPAGWPDIRPGDRVVVEGAMERGSHAPRMRPSSVRVVGTAPLPEPVEASGSIFLSADNAIRARVAGIVQRARCDNGVWHLAVFVGGHRLYVRSALPPDDGQAGSLIDAEVRLTGVTGSIRNSRGQLLGPLLMVNGFHDIERLGPPPPPEFETAFVPLDEVARFGEAALDGHRFQTEGVVTRGSPGRYLFLQAETTGIYVETDDAARFEPGDRVRVAGFLDLGQKVRGIAAAAVRRVGREPPPQPVSTRPELIVAAGEHADAEENAFPDFANRLVTFPAKIIGMGPSHDGGSLQLDCDGIIIDAKLQSAAFRTASQFPAGTEIAVTGNVRYDRSRPAEERVDGRVSPFDAFSLLVHLPEDVVLVKAAPWWTPLRLAAAIAGLLVVLAAALAWAAPLRSQVRRHVRTIAVEMQGRREAAVEYQATLRERTRLAANLHDTLLQTMAGIGYQIEACRVAADVAQPAEAVGIADHLDVARRMIDHAVDDIRGSVWALRSTAVAGTTLEDAIKGAVGRMVDGQSIRTTVRSTGAPFPLPSFVTGNLMLIVQEAVFNAIRHAGPRTVDVEIAYQGSRGVEAVVRDDGAGFLPGTERGPAEGHFGLQGMRERAERLGGRLAVESVPGQGTTVRCAVPCRDYDLAIEREAGEQHALADRPIDAAQPTL